MKIYVLNRMDTTGYDEMKSIVVVAENPTEARQEASLHHGDEGAKIWFNNHETSCIEVTSETKGVVCRNFNNG